MEDVIVAKYTHIEIPNYTLGDKQDLEKYLSVWNDLYYQYEPIALRYDDKSKKLFIPRGIDLHYLERIFNYRIETSFIPDNYTNVSIKLKVMPRDDLQKNGISFLIGEGKFSYTSKYSQLLLSLGTGDGKTYTTIAGICLMGMTPIVITHIDKIKQQWFDSFIKFTDIHENQICDINSTKKLEKILQEKKLKYKVYLVNHGTIQSYANKHGWDTLSEVFSKLGIGIKVYDEAHLHFSNILKIDLSTNTKRTIYLTATFGRTDPNEKRLFSLCFKGLARYGLETREMKRKHIVYVSIHYNTYPGLDEEAYVTTFKGFNKIRYTDYQLSQPKFFDVIHYLLEYFLKYEGKILILSSKIESTEMIKDYISNWYPEKKVGVYHSKISEAEKQKVLEEADIISSTPKSMGTGVHIDGLRITIMTESYSSDVQADQTSGRLREFNDTDYTFYVELVDEGFKKVKEMYKKRLPVFKKKCYKILEIDYELK